MSQARTSANRPSRNSLLWDVLTTLLLWTVTLLVAAPIRFVILAAPTSPIVTFILLLLALNVTVLVWLSRKTRDPDEKALWLVRVCQVFSNLLLFISVLAHP